MKTNFRILAILLGLLISSVLLPKQASAQQGSVSFQTFYDELSPYGEWVDNPDYGYVWIPNEGPDFVPYSTEGNWIYTNYGWTWASNYEWGWAPFHYGRWDYSDYYGWFWAPDIEWGPAWVTWRRADGYFGWEPMAPGISLSLSFGSGYNSTNDHWIFVRDRDFERPDFQNYYVNRNEHDQIIRNSNVINKTYVDRTRKATYVIGPARADVQKATGRKINSVSIQENSRPGQNLSNGRLTIYRPQVNKNNDKGQRPEPKRVSNMTDVKQQRQQQDRQQPQRQQPQPQRQQPQPQQQQRQQQEQQKQVQQKQQQDQRQQQEQQKQVQQKQQQDQRQQQEQQKQVQQKQQQDQRQQQEQQKQVQQKQQQQQRQQQEQQKQVQQKQQQQQRQQPQQRQQAQPQQAQPQQAAPATKRQQRQQNAADKKIKKEQESNQDENKRR
jgi:hypothetical protein